MPSLVGLHKSAFMNGRCMHDNFQLVQGTARRLHSRGTAAVMLKLDITKAFDTVDWAFLLEVLSRMEFGDHWLSIVCGLLSSASTRVLVNRVAGGYIANKRGLQQGVPLSSLLFIKVMPCLHYVMYSALANYPKSPN